MRIINENPNMSKKKTEMPSLSPEERVLCSDEVYLGFTEEEALAEASRCLNCPYQYCKTYCPAHNHIPEFIEKIRERDYEAAWEILAKTNPMMEISCRVCPYEKQCESHCTRAIKGEAVAIGALERFIAEWHAAHAEKALPEKKEKNGFQAAIIGGGPAGLSCAFSLALSGFDVSIYEKRPTLGGVSSWGIPSFVLPEKYMQNLISRLEDYDVHIHLNTEVGKDITLAELKEKNDALFLAIGAELPVLLQAKGSELPQVIQAADYLPSPEAFQGKNILVIGGGNTAIDAARSAKRQASTENVKILYRRTKEDMPASTAELKLAEEEGIEILPLLAPTEFHSEEGKLSALSCSVMELTAPDYPGGRNNVEPGSERKILPCDLVILALGFKVAPFAGIRTDDENRILVDENLETDQAMIFAGGDCVSGAGTLIKASAAGKEAAAQIFGHLPLYLN